MLNSKVAEDSHQKQLLSLAVHNAKRMGHEKVTVDDVEVVKNLFMDVKEASEYLRRYEERLLSH